MIFTTTINEFSNIANPPKNVYYKGNLELLKMPKIAIVGSRKMSVYTKNAVEILAKKLSKAGFCIVSGGALGVDICALNAALPNVISVFANGLDLIYPKSNEKIINQIYTNSLAISENPPNHMPKKYDFLARNRLVVALSKILIIAQADNNSGSLNSANHAINQNKEIYVLAQRINESNGTNKLLANKQAKIIYDIDIFVEQLMNKFNLYENLVIKNDEFLEFCKNGVSLDEALEKYGNLVYDYELDGKIVIDGVLVRSV